MSGWDISDITSQAGRTWVVTGANSGLGLVTARELARAGAEVTLGCRDPQRGQAALEDVRAAATGAEPHLAQLDLADLGSVRHFASVVTESVETLDGLVNNAGVMAPPREETADGFELQIGTNHLGHFALTGLLIDRLMAAEARVVTVSSGAHKIGSMDFEDLNGEESYSRWRRYGQSKLANLLFAYELQRRSDAGEWGIKSVAAHPGYASTHLQSAGPGIGGGIYSIMNVTVMKVTNLVLAQSDEMGALPTLYAATVPEMPAGGFVGPSGPGEMRGHPKLVSSTKASRSEADAKRLWKMSEELTGVAYPASSPVST